MLYTLHPIDDELRNFQTMLENCVKVTLVCVLIYNSLIPYGNIPKNGVQHWVSVCNAETQPDKGVSEIT